MARGVHYKALYERETVNDPKIAPYIDGWIAGGEEARVFDGEVPYKFVVFDQEVVLSTIISRSGPPAALFVRHAPYAPYAPGRSGETQESLAICKGIT